MQAHWASLGPERAPVCWAPAGGGVNQKGSGQRAPARESSGFGALRLGRTPLKSSDGRKLRSEGLRPEELQPGGAPAVGRSD
eukprot:14384388-Alexandrium_andersonii.AAC.1